MNTDKIPLTGPYVAGYFNKIPLIVNSELDNEIRITRAFGRKTVYNIIFEEPKE